MQGLWPADVQICAVAVGTMATVEPKLSVPLDFEGHMMHKCVTFE